MQSNGDVDETKNTGNIAKQITSFNGLAHPFVQTFKYDSLYRLTEAKEISNNQQTWKQLFAYDRFGNRTTHDKYTGTSLVSPTNLTHPEINPATNRFTTQGFVYDKNGNLTQDPTNSVRQFIFNGENKQTQVKDANGNNIGEYFYDGEGKRVKKKVYDPNSPNTVTEETVFIYDGLGKLVSEYSTKITPQSERTISYTATDQLDSPRVITDANGNVISRRDFMPFGEELYADNQTRTTNNKYSTSNEDKVRQRFTGYQKDTETQLDFAEARYYNNLHARFTAVDPLLASGKSANPQTFNRYVYVGNNPIIRTDPKGLEWIMKNRTDGSGLFEYAWRTGKELEEALCNTCKNGGWQLMPLDKDGKFQFTRYIDGEAIGLFEVRKDGSSSWVTNEDGEIKSTKPYSNRTWYSLPDGWIAAVDKFPDGAGGASNFEIHVYDPVIGTNKDVGVIRGRAGWVGKHGGSTTPPDGIPHSVLRRLNAINLKWLRRIGGERGLTTGQPFRRGAYLNAGARLFTVLNITQGLVYDYETYRNAQRNGKTFAQEVKDGWRYRKDEKYLQTVMGFLPNPCYGGCPDDIYE